MFLLAWRGWADMTGKEPKQGKTEMSRNRETDMRGRPPQWSQEDERQQVLSGSTA